MEPVETTKREGIRYWVVAIGVTLLLDALLIVGAVCAAHLFATVFR